MFKKSISKNIVAIGGGDTSKYYTLAIDKEIIRLSGKKTPLLLFIPTASSDNDDYVLRMQKHFGKKLGCHIEMLLLLKTKPTLAEIRKKISTADIIYVGSGNTLKMMRLWRRLGVDRLLKAAYHQGTVLCGPSAGSICWFDSGHSDSMSFYNPKDWQYINVTGLGLIRGVHCPHYDSHTLHVPRKKSFKIMMQQLSGFGIAIEDRCAIHFQDGQFYRVLSANGKANAYRVYKNKGVVVEEKLALHTKLHVKDLYKK